MRTSILFMLFCAWPVVAGAHQGHHHEHGEAPIEHKEKLMTKSAADRIGESYSLKIRPIFEAKCLACHGERPVAFPWYYKVPLVHGLIESDIKEAHEHLDMAKGFPFAGHGTPKEDLQAIRKDIEEGDMPPWRYTLMHPEARLSETEKQLIYQWVDESLKMLDEKK